MNRLGGKNWFVVITCLIVGLAFLVGAAYGQGAAKVSEETFKNLQWRCVGPAIMGGRIDDFAVVESQPWIIYVATASGGVWKTTNNGVTWEPIFDNENTSTIGTIAVAPSDPSIVWAGTGEPNNRQSSSWGDGVYKSTDGGKSWTNMGLMDSHHIGRVVIHSTNPDIVYVAALGHLWGSNKQRGLFKTADGGKTWVNTLFINEDTGFVDVAIDPYSPDTLYAAAYQRRRTGYGFSGGGPHSGLHKTTDGGKTWTHLTNGLPGGDTGRIGVYIYRKDPNIVYAIIENKDGGVFRSEDKGLSWKKMSSTNPRPMYYSKIRIDPNNDQRIWVLGARMYTSEDGGITFRTDVVTRVHGDHHAMWINPANSNYMVLGSDGGIYFSYDRGKTWDFVWTLPLGQFYEVGADMRKPYYIYGGLQDNGSWGGPSATMYRQGITNEDWFRVGGGDGFYVQVDPTDHTLIYAESQNGNLFHFNLKTGEQRSIRPMPKEGEKGYQFNWNSPVLISPHNPSTIYYGGNRLFKSTDRGETWTASDDLTTKTDRDKVPIMRVLVDENTPSRHDGISFYGTMITISESPVKEGLLYVGTDDGNLQVSRDGGETWKNVIGQVPGVPQRTYVSRVVASYFEEGGAYATFDGHRNDDFKPYVYITNNYGESWKSISNNLPVGGTVNVIREHPRNPDLLFVGTERGAYVSFDRGGQWVQLKNNLPMVPVDDILIHPRDNDLIFGTHGRSIWILDDITPLEQLNNKVLDSDAYLFDIRPAMMFNYYSHKGNTGHKAFVASNPPFGAIISYYLRWKITGLVKITVMDKAGEVIRELSGTKEAGINRIAWDLRYTPPVPPEAGEEVRFRRGPVGPFVLPGEYVVKLTVGEQEMTKNVRVEGDPRIVVSEADRRAQQEAVFTLNRLYASGYKANMVSNNIKTQLNNLKESLKKLPQIPEAVTSAVDSLDKQVDKILGNLVGSPELRRRGISPILSEISRLSSGINRYTGAPTPYQAERIRLLPGHMRDIIEALNTLIEKSIPELNRLMNENNIPWLIPVKPIKMP